ncbi:MAG: WG repeat-containing protein [Candidatus Brocadiia bacterium]
MKRAVPIVVCLLLAAATGCCEEVAPPAKAGDTVLLCPAAFGPEGGGCGLIDRDNNLVLKTDYQSILVQDHFLVVRNRDRIGLLTRDGRLVSPCISTWISVEGRSFGPSGDGKIIQHYAGASTQFAVAGGENPGAVAQGATAFRLDGTPALGDEYQFVRMLAGKFGSGARKADGKIRVFDAAGNDVGGRDFDKVEVTEGMPYILATADGKIVLYNSDFKRASSIEADQVGTYSEGLCAVRIGKRWGFIDAEGNLAIPAVLEEVGSFREGLCSAGARIKPDGEIDMEEHKDEHPNLPFGYSAPMGYIDRAGKFVIKPKYTIAEPFNDGVARVSTSGRGMHVIRFTYIDKTGAAVEEREPPKAQPIKICDAVVLTPDKKLIWSADGTQISAEVTAAVYDPGTKLVFYRTKDMWGIINPATRFVGPVKYGDLKSWTGGLVLAGESWNWYLIDGSGQQIGDGYASIEFPVEGLSLVKERYTQRVGYVDATGKTVIAPTYSSGQSFSGGRAAVFDGAWGFIDKAGKWVVEPRFDRATSFWNGMATVALGGKWGAIDATGRLAIPFAYDEPVYFTGNVAPVRLPTKWGCLNADGKTVIEPQFDSIASFTSGIAIAGQGGLYGAIDATGAWVIPPKYFRLEHLGEGVLAYTTSLFPMRAGLMDAGGKILCEPLFDKWRKMSEGRLGVAALGSYGYTWGFVDHEAGWVVTPQYKEVGDFREGIAPVCPGGDAGGMWGFIDKTGAVVSLPRRPRLDRISEGLARYFEADRWGYVDRKGNVIIERKYIEAGDFRRGVAQVATVGWHRFLINTKGEEVSPRDVEIGERVVNGFIARKSSVEDSSKWLCGVTDDSGKWIIQPEYSELRSYEGQYPLFGKKDGKPCYVDEKGTVLFVDAGAEKLSPYSGGYAHYFVLGIGNRVIDRTGRVAFTWPFEMRNFEEVPLPRRAAGEAK